MIGNTVTLKEMNTELLRSTLKKMESGTKNSLAKLTGLSVATCRNFLTEMLETGEVKEIQLADSTGGRPSKQFVYNKDHAHALLLYIRKEGSVRSLFLCIIDVLGNPLKTAYKEFSELTLEDIESQIQVLKEQDSAIRVISIGLPGVVHDGVIKTCDIPTLIDLPIVEQLSNRFGVPVLAENDVNAIALGFYYYKNRSESESLVYIYYPEKGCVGAGIIIDGSVIRGRRDFAGELSYLPCIEAPGMQARMQEDEAAFSKLAVDMILSVNCVINPSKAVISGLFITPSLKDRITHEITERGQPFCTPIIEFDHDIHDSFILGLQYLALKELSYKYTISER